MRYSRIQHALRVFIFIIVCVELFILKALNHYAVYLHRRAREYIVAALLKMTSHHAGFVLLQGSYGTVHDTSESDSVSRH